MAADSQPGAFKLISFDLDNTLYDNQPVLDKAEALSSAYLQQAFCRQRRSCDLNELIKLRKKNLLSGDLRFENLSFARFHALKQFCEGLDHSLAIAEKAFEIFLNARSQVSIVPEICALLTELVNSYPLVSVTNGNCEGKKLSINEFFKAHYRVESGVRAKPHPQMLNQVIQDFNLRPDQLLHIGDCPQKDGDAASAAGAGFYLFEPFAAQKQLTQEIELLRQFLQLK